MQINNEQTEQTVKMVLDKYYQFFTAHDISFDLENTDLLADVMLEFLNSLYITNKINLATIWRTHLNDNEERIDNPLKYSKQISEHATQCYIQYMHVDNLTTNINDTNQCNTNIEKNKEIQKKYFDKPLHSLSEQQKILYYENLKNDTVNGRIYTFTAADINDAFNHSSLVQALKFEKMEYLDSVEDYIKSFQTIKTGVLNYLNTTNASNAVQALNNIIVMIINKMYKNLFQNFNLNNLTKNFPFDNNQKKIITSLDKNLYAIQHDQKINSISVMLNKAKEHIEQATTDLHRAAPFKQTSLLWLFGFIFMYFIMLAFNRNKKDNKNTNGITRLSQHLNNLLSVDEKYSNFLSISIQENQKEFDQTIQKNIEHRKNPKITTYKKLFPYNPQHNNNLLYSNQIKNDESGQNSAQENMNNLFFDITIDFLTNTNYQQAMKIITEVLQQVTKHPNKQVGITYSANYQQTVQINNSYKHNQYLTNISGGNQAEVIYQIEQILNSTQYKHLQKNFRILPITTCQFNGGVGAVQDQWLHDDLNNIKNFLEDGNIVLGWRNQDTQQNQYAIGGGISQQLTAQQNKTIQNKLQEFKTQYNQNTDQLRLKV